MSPVDRGFPFGEPWSAGFLFLNRGVADGVVLGLTGAREIGNKKAARRRLSCAMEPATGLEPVTPALRERCSTN